MTNEGCRFAPSFVYYILFEQPGSFPVMPAQAGIQFSLQTISGFPFSRMVVNLRIETTYSAFNIYMIP
jgi:hypothetical protein